MGIRREEEMEMSDDEIEETTETKETEESGNDDSALLCLISMYSQGWYFQVFHGHQPTRLGIN